MRIVAVILACGLMAAACSGNDPSGEAAREVTEPTVTVGAATPPPTSAVAGEPDPTVEAVPVEDQPEIIVLGESPEGFVYYVEYATTRGAPNGRLLVDAGSVKPAVLDPTREFPAVHDMAFGPDGLVAFTSEGSFGPRVFVGRIDAEGSIRDLHLVGGGVYRFSGYDLSTSFDDDGVLRVGELVYDPLGDPMFVMSADPVPAIDEDNPLIESLSVPTESFLSHWYSGDTLGAEPACGAQTLYRSSLAGWVRVVHPLTEIDPVVDIVATEAVSVGGIHTSWTERSLVLSTECPSEYEGRRIYLANDSINYGDGGPAYKGTTGPRLIQGIEVAEVLGIRELREDSGGGSRAVAWQIDVRRIDGSVVTISPAVDGEGNLVSAVAPPTAGDDGFEPVPLPKLGPGIWLLQGVGEPARVVRTELETGDVIEEVWRQTLVDEPRRGHTFLCTRREAGTPLALADYFYSFRGPWLGTFREQVILDGEIQNERVVTVTGAHRLTNANSYCGQPRYAPLRVTALQLTGLLRTAGFTAIAGDHAIDPNWSAVGRWQGIDYPIDLYQGEFRPDLDVDHELLECPPGGLRLPLDLPAEARAAVLDAAECET